jgi:hypothetical protein
LQRACLMGTLNPYDLVVVAGVARVQGEEDAT